MYGKYIFSENLMKHHIKIICYTSGDIVSSALLLSEPFRFEWGGICDGVNVQHDHILTL